MISHRHRPFEYPSYVSPLPAEDLIKAGGIKQQMYNQGAEQVHSYLDNLAQYGLDVVKESDREYFGNQLQKLTDTINQSAKGIDFSNLQNVRNIMSVGRPLENDPNFINAINSTKEIRRRQEYMKNLNPKFRGAANDYDFTEDINNYLNNNNVGEKLGFKEYKPFIDPSSKIAQIRQNLEPSIRTEVTASGRYRDEKTIKQVTQQRLAQAIEASLTEAEREQIMMDAKYEVRGATPEQLQKYYQAKYEPKLNDYNFAIDTYTKHPPETPEEWENLRYLIDSAQVLNMNLKQIAEGNPEEAYSALLRESVTDFITGNAKSYAYRQAADRIHADEFALEDLRFAHDRAKAKDQAIYNQYEVDENGKPTKLKSTTKFEHDKALIDARGENALTKEQMQIDAGKYKGKLKKGALELGPNELTVGSEYKYNQLDGAEIDPTLKSSMRRMAEKAISLGYDPEDIYFKAEINNGKTELRMYDDDIGPDDDIIKEESGTNWEQIIIDPTTSNFENPMNKKPKTIEGTDGQTHKNYFPEGSYRSQLTPDEREAFRMSGGNPFRITEDEAKEIIDAR